MKNPTLNTLLTLLNNSTVVTGAELSDTIYTHETEGTFNVTKLLEAVKDGQVPALKALVPINDSHKQAAKSADTCDELVASMTPERANEPLLLIMCQNGTAFCADGNNRLRWRVEHDCADFRAFVVPYEYREAFRVRTIQNGQVLDEWALCAPTLGQHRKPTV